MASILFECDGFHVKRNTFILKTAAFKEFHKEPVIIPFASPFLYRSRSLSKQDWRSVTCERQRKGLKWNTDGLSHSKIQETLAEQLQGAVCILVHGEWKKKWLQDLLRPDEYPIKNLEDFGCPKVDDLGPTAGKAADNLQLLTNWIYNQSPELQNLIFGDVNGNRKKFEIQDSFRNTGHTKPPTILPECYEDLNLRSP